MNNFIKQVIEEKFESKAQQRYFYAQAGKGGKKGKKWAKWAKEFSNKTDFDKIPDKVEKDEDIEEIVDDKGNIAMSKRNPDFDARGISQDKTSDEVVKSGGGSMGIHGVHGTHTSLRYWAETDMSKALGYKDTLAKDEDYDDAEDHFEKDLGLSDEEAKKRMGQIGYDEDLPDDKVRLVENPKKFMEEYLESVLSKKNMNNDIVPKEGSIEEKEINPIILKQLSSLKNSLKKNNISIDDVLKHLKDDE